MIIDSRKNPKETLENLWRVTSTKKKKELLIARGLNTSWAKTKTINEMVARGGGMIASNLLELVRIHAQRMPEETKIRFDMEGLLR